MRDLQLVIMAAGMGSRYGGLKQIDEFGPGRAFLMDYAIYDAYRMGVRLVTVVVRESFAAQIEDVLHSKWKSRPDLKFQFVLQDLNDLPSGFTPPAGREKPWGTAHVLYALRNAVKTPFIIQNADDFYGRAGLQRLFDFLQEHPDRHALAGYPLEKTLSPHGAVTRGLCQVKGDRLIAIEEVGGILHGDPRRVQASMNLWAFAPSLFPHVERTFTNFLKLKGTEEKSEYLIPTMINDLLREGALEVASLPVDSPWFGVTHREDKESAQKRIAQMIAEGVYPEDLFAVEIPR